MNFSQPVNSAILVNSNMEQCKPYLELRNLSSGKDLWCIVHSFTQRKTLFKGFVKNEPQVTTIPLKETSLCHKAIFKLFDSSATICTKSILSFSFEDFIKPGTCWTSYWIISKQQFSGGGFFPTTPSIPAEHLGMSGDTFVTAWGGGCYWNLVGRGHQCCKNSYNKCGNKGSSPKLSILPILENSALK